MTIKFTICVEAINLLLWPDARSKLSLQDPTVCSPLEQSESKHYTRIASRVTSRVKLELCSSEEHSTDTQ